MPKPNVKEQLVTTSLSLLQSKGFNATSVQDITDAAGVPKGSFYNHFASKDALALEVLRRYSALASEVRSVLDDTTLPPLTRLRQYFDRLVDANAAADFNCGCLLGNFSTELSNQIPEIRQEMRLSFEDWAGVLAPVIAQGQQDGSITRAQPALELANFIIDAWQGAVLRSKAAHDRASLDRFVNMVLNNILV